jgi:hypothetical protein
MRSGILIPLLLLAACGEPALPAQPSAPAPVVSPLVSLEAEAGTGEGGAMPRPQASGGLTIHLAPDERRLWTFSVSAPQVRYAVAVTYSNDNIGTTETIHLFLETPATTAKDGTCSRRISPATRRSPKEPTRSSCSRAAAMAVWKSTR